MTRHASVNEVCRWAAWRLPETVTVCAIARGLARIPRWCGRTEPAPYSVAQHSVAVAEEIHRQTNDARQACYGLLHDGHEFVTSDVPADLKALLNRLSAGERFMHLIEGALDSHIYAGVGLAWPVPAGIAALVKEVDLRAAATEIRDLAVPDVSLDAAPLPTPIARVWPWPKAEENFIKTWDRFAPIAGLPFARRG